MTRRSLLPALANAGRQGTTAPFYDFSDGARVRADYQRMWSDLYIANRIDPLREWAHSRGLQLRLQPYGDPIDSPEAAAHLDTAEGESFGFGNNIERYKTVVTGRALQRPEGRFHRGACVRRQRLELGRQAATAAPRTCSRSTARTRPA